MTLPSKAEIKLDLMNTLIDAVNAGKLTPYQAQLGHFIGITDFVAESMSDTNRQIEKIMEAT